MYYTSRHNHVITNDEARFHTTANRHLNLTDFANSMNPKLDYLFFARDVITDSVSQEVSALRLFDTLYIYKGQTSLVYSPYIVGKLNLNGTGTVKSETKLRMLDPDGMEVKTISIKGDNLLADKSITLRGIFWLAVFTKVGRYSVEASVSVNDGQFVRVGEPIYFWVEQQV